ncbi:hypothetical protein ACLMJK_000016 [Lecanora helva]
MLIGILQFFEDGDDGSWSSFALRVGKPEQVSRVLPSTAGQATWVVTPGGCLPGEVGTDPSMTCEESRGGFFDISKSKSWDVLGNYTLNLEANFGDDGLSATYGKDTVALGFTDSNGGPSLDSQIVTGLETNVYYMGVFGLGSQGTNITNFTDSHPSFLATMKAKNLIPSMSWAYTAGASYRSKGVFGSLTFGGYDVSRFVPNQLSFSMAPDISRDLVVGLQSVSATTANNATGPPQDLLPTPILTFIDSTFPYIYLPVESCLLFEKAFGLVWNDTDEMYWVNDTTHQALLTANPNITFTLANGKTGGSTVDISLPYASFDLEVKNPYPTVSSSPKRYFPLQRAANESQYTLGRTFLQEAYLITDYERSNFSISRCAFQDSAKEKLVTIPSTTKSVSAGHKNAIIGTAIGVAFVAFLVAVLIWLIIRRPQDQTQGTEKASKHSSDFENSKIRTVCSVREIDNNSLCGPFRELPDNGRVELLDNQSPSGSGNDISEMSQPIKYIVHELGTHHSSKQNSITLANIAENLKIVKSTEISRESRTDCGSLECSPVVETTISASTRASTSDLEVSTPASTAASAVSPPPPPDLTRSDTDESLENADSSKRVRLKQLDLDRSLPPTPISESPQLFPSSRAVSFRRGPHNSKASAIVSPWTSVYSYIPASKFSNTKTGSGKRPLPSLRGLETTIPPASSPTDDPDDLSISNGEPVINTTWL